MDNEMIERVAIALANNFKAQVEANADMPFAETKVSMPAELIWITYAVAAIKAMREPTEKMIEAGEATFTVDDTSAEDTYTAMIDSITND